MSSTLSLTIPTEINYTKRHRFRWSVNEINRLYNEYEIKELTIRQILNYTRELIEQYYTVWK